MSSCIRILIASLSLIVLAACGAETIVHKIDEKQANNIIVLLGDSNIYASKVVIDDGRNVTYNINVPSKQRTEALRMLELHDYPKKVINGYGEVFKGEGLIPTAAEESAKKLQAIEGEIEKQLSLISGVQAVEVNIVMPEESPLKTTDEARAPTTASVTVKYLPGKGGAKPLSEPQVQAVVAAAVEKLTPDHVVVVMTPAGVAGSPVVDCPDPGGTGAGFCCKLSAKQQTFVAAGVLILVLILGLVIVFGQIRLRTVRSRLLRLQNEIAKARRKSELPPGA